MPTLTHPKLPGREITVDEAQATVHEKAGWKRKSDKAPRATAPAKPKPLKADVEPTATADPGEGTTDPTSPDVGEEN
jgi:hypothetical protein